MIAPDILWSVTDPDRLHHVHWSGEDEHLLFNTASGDLHLLNAEAISLINGLMVRPTSVAQLSVGLDAEQAATVRYTVELLDRLGVLSPVAL